MPLPAIIGGIAAGAGLLGGIADDRNARKSAQQLEEQRNRAQEYIQRAVGQGRGDLFRNFRQGQQQTRGGLEAGIDLYNQSVPQQLQTFQSGNIGAQNQLINGLASQNAAILGYPTNYNPQASQVPMPQVSYQPQPFLPFDDLTYYQAFPQNQEGLAGGVQDNLIEETR